MNNRSHARLAILIPAALLSAGAAKAQAPSINPGGVANAASYLAANLPGGGIAQGALFVVFGRNLGPAQLQQVSTFPLRTGLAGTSIRATVSGTPVDCLMIYTSAGQVAAILPSSTPIGNGTITVTYNGQTSTPEPLRVVRNAFGLFTLNEAGVGPAVAQNFITDANQPVNGLTRAARAGQVITLWGTGLGAVSGDEASGPRPGDLFATAPAEVYIGNRRANVLYRGRSGCCAGVDQIIVEVPTNAEGCFVSVAVRVGDVVSNHGTIAIARETGRCTEPFLLGDDEFALLARQGNLRLGQIALSRSTVTLRPAGAPVPIISRTDSGDASFYRLTADSLERSLIGGVSIGSCMVWSFNGDNTSPLIPFNPQVLDAGAQLRLTGPRGERVLNRNAAGGYSAQIGGNTGSFVEYIEPGTFRVEGSGGSGPANVVGAFAASLNLGPLFNWSNEAAVNTIDRSTGLDISWTGGDPGGFVTITGISASGSPSRGAVFTCIERVTTGRFTVQPQVLLSLPPTGSSPADLSVVSVSSATTPTVFSAPGLDRGNFVATVSTGKSVRFQ